MTARPSRPAACGGAIFLFTGLVYLATLSPTVNSFDSAELIAGAYSLGIVHAPGYPLYLLLAHAIARLPIGTPAYNVNLFSALCASLAAAITFAAGLRLSSSRWSAAVAALTLALSRLYWSQAVVAEVYALNALLIAGVVWTAIGWSEKPTAGRLIGLAGLYGLSLTHHPSAWLLAPGLAGLLAAGGRRRWERLGWRAWVWAAGALLAPLALYLYLPIRFAAAPALNYVGDYFDVNLASPQGVIWMATGRMFGAEVFGRPLAEGLAQALSLLNHLFLNLLGAGLLLAMYGLAALKGDRGLALFLGGGALATLAFYAYYNVVDSAQMLLPALVLLAPPLALGLERFPAALAQRLSLTPSAAWHLKAGLLASLILLLLAVNKPYADRHEDWTAYRFADAVLTQVEPEALLLAQWTSATPLHYMQIVEGRRPDVEILDRGLLALAVRDRFTRAGRRDPAEHNAAALAALRSLVERSLARRPVYLLEPEAGLQQSFEYIPLPNGIYQLLNR